MGVSDRLQTVIESTGPGQTRQLGEILGRLAQAGDLICLTGELGAGKTTLIQGMGQGLEITDRVTSPSFTIIHQHEGRLPFYHVDLYRLSPDQVPELGLEEYLESPSAVQPEGVVAIEWADRLPACYRSDRLSVHLSFLPDDDRRQVQFAARGDRAERLLQDLQAKWKEVF